MIHWPMYRDGFGATTFTPATRNVASATSGPSIQGIGVRNTLQSHPAAAPIASAAAQRANCVAVKLASRPPPPER